MIGALLGLVLAIVAIGVGVLIALANQLDDETPPIQGAAYFVLAGIVVAFLSVASLFS